MSAPVLSSIHIYPVKSMAGITLDRSFVEPDGLSFDRRFLLSAPDGTFITARTKPALLGFKTALRPDGLTIVSPDGDSISVCLPELFDYYRQVVVWGCEINAQRCPPEVDGWFSEKLGTPCELLYFGEQSSRGTPLFPDSPVAFADGYPLLLTTTASLDELSKRAERTFDMRQFRPNIVIDDTTPFAEDHWTQVRIGSVVFDLVKPCSRCVMTTYHPDTLERLSGSEPLRTLASFRRRADEEVYFGQNLIPRSSGVIEVGDHVEIL